MAVFLLFCFVIKMDMAWTVLLIHFMKRNVTGIPSLQSIPALGTNPGVIILLHNSNSQRPDSFSLLRFTMAGDATVNTLMK